MPKIRRRVSFDHTFARLSEKELYQMEQAKTMSTDFKGITATYKELREGGYFPTGKPIVLGNIHLQNKNTRTEETARASKKKHIPIKKHINCKIDG